MTVTAQSRARFRPMLVVVAAALAAPTAVLAGPAGEPDIATIVAGGVLTVGAVTARVLVGRGSVARREIVGIGLIAGALGVLVLLMARSVLPTADFIGLAAALSVSTAAMRRDRLRWAAQGTTFAAVAVLLVLDAPDRGPVTFAVEVGGPLALLLAVGLVASALAGELERARHREVATRQAADRRAELLATVRTLARAGSDEAADASVAAVVRFGFEVGAVGFLEGDRVVPRRSIGLSWERASTSDRGQVGVALARDRTIVHADYRRVPGAYTHLDLGTMVLAPVRVDGRPQGILIAARRSSGDPVPDDVELIEILAAHLGASLQTERSVANQAMLLTRLRDLEALRTGFVSRVSEDLRDPLTIVQGLAQTLGRHGERLDPARRDELLKQLTRQAQSLGATLETLLDFSRFQREHAEPNAVDVDVVALLAPALTGSGVALDVRERSTVHVDVGLVRRAFELLRRAADDDTTIVRLDRRRAEAVIDVLWSDQGTDRGMWHSLAEHLLVLAGGHCEWSSEGLRLSVPLATVHGSVDADTEVVP